MFGPFEGDDHHAEQAAVLALVGATDIEWHKTASLIEEAGSALRIIRGEWSGFEPAETATVRRWASRVTEEDLTRYSRLISELSDSGVGLLTVLDYAYPMNLRQVFNRPPFVFVRGHLESADDRAVAVVGTRKPSDEGLRMAAELASQLTSRNVTVLSGLAEGIDAAAHRGALEAGGRTVAVIGTGIRAPTYPKKNDQLAGEIVGVGAVISQFWPDAPPTRVSFPMRNVVMSGMAVGTVVVEASATSGAKMQARLALDHGKRVFLVESLVLSQDWAKQYAQRPNAVVVRTVEDILAVIDSADTPVTQLRLT